MANIEFNRGVTWRHLVVWCLVGGSVVAGLFAAVCPVIKRPAPRSIPNDGLSNQVSHQVFVASRILPFSAADVARNFAIISGRTPHRAGPGIIVFEGPTHQAFEDYYRILVKSEGASVTVVLLARGDYGITLLREFFESPLFRADETRQLYLLLGKAQTQSSAQLRRFSVHMTFSRKVDSMVLALRFSPPTLRAERQGPHRTD